MMNLFYIESLSPLYEDVQSSEIFEDSKFFTDCVPKHSTAEIIGWYQQEKGAPDFDLRHFVETHFIFPETPTANYESAGRRIDEHLQHLWGHLTRQADTHRGGTLIPLPHPYIVPGGRFREIYYWDSYFTLLGLKISGQTTLMANMVDNFVSLLTHIGFIPNGNRTYYLGRSQPPFFALMVDLLCDQDPQKMAHYRPFLEKEYNFWMDGSENLSGQSPAHRRVVRLPDGHLLNRYWDDQITPRPEAWKEDTHLSTASGRPAEEVWRHIRAAAESGWDFSSRWFKDGQHFSTIQTTNLLPVDLNCLLLFLEQSLQKIYALEKNVLEEKAFAQKSEARQAAIAAYCWDEDKGYFFDYNYVEGASTGHYNLAGLFPLFFKMASPNQAIKVAAHVETAFLKSGGVVTTLTHSGQQWDAPNGWAPLQWVAFIACRNYGMVDLADKIRKNWLHLNETVYTSTGKMMEKYNVEDLDVKAGGGEYPNQDGFGWTNGVYLAMKEE